MVKISKQILFLLWLLILRMNSYAQFVPYRNIEIASQQFSVDNLGNIFSLQKGIISKYNSDGQLQNVYQDKGGMIDFIDAINPLRVIGYSSAFATIYFFDTQLALQSTIKLREALNGDPLLVCHASATSFWVYDQATTILTSYNDQLQIQAQSQPLNLTVPDFSVIKKMYETEKWLILLTEKNKLLVFDMSGNYFKSIESNDVLDFCITSEAIITLEKHSIKLFGIKSNEITDLTTNYTPNGYGIKFSNKKLFIADPTQISILKLAE